jgi:hypothetical protein
LVFHKARENIFNRLSTVSSYSKENRLLHRNPSDFGPRWEADHPVHAYPRGVANVLVSGRSPFRISATITTIPIEFVSVSLFWWASELTYPLVAEFGGSTPLLDTILSPIYTLATYFPQRSLSLLVFQVACFQRVLQKKKKIMCIYIYIYINFAPHPNYKISVHRSLLDSPTL